MKDAHISVQEAAALADVSPQLIRNLYNKGDLRGFKLTEGETAPIRIYRDAVIKWIKRVQGRTVK